MQILKWQFSHFTIRIFHATLPIRADALELRKSECIEPMIQSLGNSLSSLDQS